MPYDPKRGNAALRRGRWSAPFAEYFITAGARRPTEGLTTPSIGEAVLQEMALMDRDGTWRLRCATVMPDHLHLLIILGERLSLGQSVARLKAKAATHLLKAGLEWQAGFYDHRLAETDDRAGVFRYIYRNPYVQKLIPSTAAWPYWYCRPDDWKWFRHELHDERPPASWLQ